MITRTVGWMPLSVSVLLLWLLWPLSVVSSNTTSAASGSEEFVVTYVMFDDDEYYRPRRANTGLKLSEPKRPLDGVKLGLKESRILGRSMKLAFILNELSLLSTDNYLFEIERALLASGSVAVVVDFPKAEMLKVVKHFKDRDILFLNARLSDDDLRSSLCQPNLFHTLPSQAMLMDALVQFLMSKNWKKYLVLEGPLEQDRLMVSAFARAAKKFGGKIVDTKEFLLSNNPRDRGQTNIPIMTGGSDHDAIFVADTYGEFARYVPYQTYLSRLVVGSDGLISDAWHWTWERHGAPQLNQRFDRLSARRLASTEWAGWAAVKSLTIAVSKTRATEFSVVSQYLRSAELTLDLYKGSPGNFRPWNNQLRQPVLLHTHTAVVKRAPVEGYLHQVNNLDTLGADKGESDCRW